MRLILTIMSLLLISHNADATKIIQYEGKPITIELTVGKERSINFGDHVQVGMTANQKTRNLFRTQTAQGYVHILANKEFENERVQVKRISDGVLMLIDFTARIAGNYIEEVAILTPDQAKKSNRDPFSREPESTSMVNNAPNITPVDLTRYASQLVYAPKRIIQSVPGIDKSPLGIAGEIKLFKGINRAFVRATPVFSLKGGGYHLAAIHLVNTSYDIVQLDYLDLNLPFTHATFQHHTLRPRGHDGDDTVLYLIGDKPLTQILVPWDFYAPKALPVTEEDSE